MTDFVAGRIGSTSTIEVRGDLDLAGIPAFRERVLEAISAGATGLVVDLSETDLLDFDGLGALVGAYARMRAQGGEFALVAPSSSVIGLLEMSGIVSAIPVAGSITEIDWAGGGE